MRSESEIDSVEQAPPQRRADTALPLIEWSFYAFVFSIPFEFANIGPVTVSKAFGYVFFALALCQPKLCFRRPPLAIWLFGSYVWMLLAHGFVNIIDDPEGVCVRLLVMIQMATLLWVGYNLMRQPELAWRAFTAFAVAGTTVALLELVGVGTTSYGAARATALEWNPNELAGHLAIAGFVWLSMMFASPGSRMRGATEGVRTLVSGKRTAVRRGRPTTILGYLRVGALGLATGVIVLAIARTGSRGGMLAMLAGGLCFLLRSEGGGQRLRSAIAVLIGLVGACLVILLTPGAATRWAMTFATGDTASRGEVFDSSTWMILQHPFSGWGVFVGMQRLNVLANHADTHNTILYVLVETGLMGFVPYMIAVALCVINAWRGRDSLHGVLPLASMVMLTVAGFSGSWLATKLHWLVAAYALAAGTKHRGPKFTEDSGPPQVGAPP